MKANLGAVFIPLVAHLREVYAPVQVNHTSHAIPFLSSEMGIAFPVRTSAMAIYTATLPVM
jgi:hypothetical protein